MSRQHHKLILLNLIIFVLLFLLPQGISSANVQPETDWSNPAWIPGLVDSDPNQYPILVSDGTGQVHAFHSQWVGEVFSIVYTKWITGVGWTEPVDIVRSPREEARVRSAFLDKSGMVNLFFWGGNDQGADIYFTQAPLVSVGKASAWREPQIIGGKAIAPATVGVVSDYNGNIFVLYSGNEEGNALYSTQSEDRGETWSEPAIMFYPGSDQLWPSALQVYQSPSQKIYAVWSLADITGNSLRIFFSAFDKNTGEWSIPSILAEAIGAAADTASIIEHDESLFVIYHNSFPMTRWMIRSFDGGKTWTSPTRLFDQVGSNGAAALVQDSGGRLHMFFGNRVGSPIVHGLWHSIWQDGTWSLPEVVISGPQKLTGINGEEGFDPSYAQAITIRGNLLLVIWRHDPMAGPIRIWYSYHYLTTPQIPVATPIPAIQSDNNIFSTVLPSPAFPETQTQVPFAVSPSKVPNFSFITVLVTALLPTFAIIILLIVLRVRR